MLSKMTIRGRLIFGYLIIAALMIMIALVALIQFGKTNQRLNELVDGTMAADTAIKMCRIEINTAARNVREMVLNTNQEANAEYEKTINQNLTNLNTYLQEVEAAGAVEESLFQSYAKQVDAWTDIAKRATAEAKNGNSDQAIKIILEECSPALKSAVEMSAQLTADLEQKQSTILKSNSNMLDIIRLLIFIFVIAGIVLAFVMAKLIISSIMRPLRSIGTLSEELAKGNLQSKNEFRSEDEIGKIAGSLEDAVKSIAAYIADIDRAMLEFSAGNFDLLPSQPFIGDFKNIEHSFDGFMDKMANVMSHIQSASEQVAAGAEQVSQSSNHLAEGAVEQTAVIDDLSERISGVADSISVNATNASDINHQVVSVGQQVEMSNRKMQDMVEAMNRISESSDKIRNIIGTINSIAEQTNLLALNASIEAARAGESGKGFAVVADQVGVLASQSAVAAKDSANLIEESVKAVENGRILVEETAQGLISVVEGAREIAVKVDTIAKESEMQAQSITQISGGMEQIQEVVQTNSSAAEESTAASEELTGQAEVLKDLMAQFKIRKC